MWKYVNEKGYLPCRIISNLLVKIYIFIKIMLLSQIIQKKLLFADKFPLFLRYCSPWSDVIQKIKLAESSSKIFLFVLFQVRSWWFVSRYTKITRIYTYTTVGTSYSTKNKAKKICKRLLLPSTQKNFNIMCSSSSWWFNAR